MNFSIRLIEIELIDNREIEEEKTPDIWEGSSSKLNFTLSNISSTENKLDKKNQISFGNITFKIFETPLIEGIELNYKFDSST